MVSESVAHTKRNDVLCIHTKVGDMFPIFSRLQVTVPSVIAEATSLDNQEIAVCLNRCGQNHQSRGWECCFVV